MTSQLVIEPRHRHDPPSMAALSVFEGAYPSSSPKFPASADVYESVPDWSVSFTGPKDINSSAYNHLFAPPKSQEYGLSDTYRRTNFNSNDSIVVDDMPGFPRVASLAYRQDGPPHLRTDFSTEQVGQDGTDFYDSLFSRCPSPSDSVHSHADADSNLRSSLKIVRDPSKTAYDFLPSGESLGAFANRHAVERYSRKVESKRERARETRRRKRKAGILYAGQKKNHRSSKNGSSVPSA